MRFSRITIFVLIASLLLQPFAPAIVQAAPVQAGDKGTKESDLSTADLPPFPEDDKKPGIDWSTVDWDAPITLPADMETFNQKLSKLQQDGKFEAIAKLKPVQRLMSDPEVLAHYGAPVEVRDLVRGYLLNKKRTASPEYQKTLLAMLRLRLKSAQINSGQVLPEQSAAPDEANNVLDISKTSQLKVRHERAVKPANSGNIRAVLQWADKVNSRQDVFRQPIKPIQKSKPKKISLGAWLRSLLVDEALAYYQPTAPIITYFDGIEKQPIPNLLYQLSQTQNQDGSWGDYNRYLNTAEIALRLSNMGLISNDQYVLAITYLSNTAPQNNREIAIKARLLADLGLPNQFILDCQSMTFNSDGGYGLHPGDSSDIETTLEIITAYIHASLALPQNAVRYVLTKIEANGQMRYASGGPVSWHLMNQTARQLYGVRNAVIDGASIDAKLQLIIAELADKFGTEVDLSVFDDVDILQTLRALTQDGGNQAVRDNLWNEALSRANSWSRSTSNLAQTVAALRTMAQPDLSVSVSSSANWTNGAPIVFTVTITNRGYAPSLAGKLYWAADDFMLTTGQSTAPLPPGGQAVLTVNFDSILTRQMIGNTRVLFYVESAAESSYDNNWAEQISAVALNVQGLPALPLYHIESQYSINGTPALNIRWLRKDDPNRANFVIVFRPTGVTAWNKIGILDSWNGAFLTGFTEGGQYEVTAGVLDKDLQTVTWLNDFTTITMSGNDALNTGTVNARVTLDASPAPNISTFGYGVSGATDAAGNITYQNVSNGSTASGVDSAAYPQYERLVTKFSAPQNGITNNVRLFSHLRVDTIAPTITGFEIRYRSNFIVKNQQTVELLAFVGDNIKAKEVDFYYYDPAQTVWLYLGTEPANSGQVDFKWDIPDTLLGIGYKVRAIARDWRGNESAATDWGPFQIINGAPPGGSVVVEGLTNNQWLLGETKNITWTSSGANAIASVSSAWLYYAPTASNYLGGNFNTAQGSISYTMPLVTGYATASAFVRLNVCDSFNNCSQIQSDPFEILDPSPPPPAPWQTPTPLAALPGSSGVDRIFQQIFKKADGSLAVLYLEFDGSSSSDPGQYRRIVYRAYTNGAWQVPVNITEYLYRNGVTTDLAFAYIQAKFDAVGALHVIYGKRTSTASSDPDIWKYDLNAQQVEYSRLSTAGVLSDQRVVSSGVVSASSPQLAFNGANRPVVFYNGGYDYVAASGSQLLYYSEDLGSGSWSAPAAVSDDQAGSFAVADDSGELAALYQWSGALKFIKRPAGGAWGTAVPVLSDSNSRYDYKLFAKGGGVYDVFYRQYNSAISRYSVNYLKLSIAGGSANIIKQSQVTSSADNRDIRVFVPLASAQGYHIIYTQWNSSITRAEYLYFDDTGTHLPAIVSPLLLSVDDSRLDAYAQNDVVGVYFSGYLGGNSTLIFNSANLSQSIADLSAPPPPADPEVIMVPKTAIKLANHNPGQMATETITFAPTVFVPAPGNLKIIWPNSFDLTWVAAVEDVSVAGGGVTWAPVLNNNLNPSSRVLTLKWTSGALTPGQPVTIEVKFVKNPAADGQYGISLSTGADGFITPLDSRNIPVFISNGSVSVTAFVPYPQTNPEISNITPTETIIVSAGQTQVITFNLKDVNFDLTTFSVTSSAGTISVAPGPASPVVSSPDGVTITFTYLANGAAGSQTITVTADDNEPTGGGAVTYQIQLFVI